MINEIINGISMKLNQAFGDDVEIYDNEVKQGLNPPCFLIGVINPSQKQFIGQRYKRDNPFDVKYFPSEAGGIAECHDVASRLFVEMSLITLTNGDRLKATSMSYEVVDGVLHFFVSFNVIVRPVEAPKDNEMGSISTTTDMKG